LDKYLVMRVLNNNVVLVKHVENSTEMILVGKGIGFGARKDAVVKIPNEKIEKSYLAYDEQNKKAYFDMLNQPDDKVIGVCSEIVTVAEAKLNGVNKETLIVLTDHISFALERIKNGMVIQNPFLHEIRSMCPDEYKVGLIAKDLIKKRLRVNINEDEVGFIAFHLCESRLNQPITNAVRQAKLLQKLVSHIEEALGIKVKEGLAYSRLVNHFRGSIERTMQGIVTENLLLAAIKNECSKHYQIAEEINEIIFSDLAIRLSDAELGYLALHINRLDKANK
jgi:transcriptional antiterminator